MTGVSGETATAYLQHRTVLYKVAYAVLWDAGFEDDVMDVLSDIAEELLRKPPSDVRNWQAFLVTMTKRRSIDHVRSAPARHRNRSDFDLDTVPSEQFEVDDLLSGIDLAKTIAIAEEERDALPEPDRTVAQQCLWDQHRQRDVADQLGISQARVSQVLKRARKTIMTGVREKGGPL